jgi:hypothetical protein
MHEITDSQGNTHYLTDAAKIKQLMKQLKEAVDAEK